MPKGAPASILDRGPTINTSGNIDEQQRQLREYDAWVFDLDNTLYPASCNLFDQVDWNMSRFIAELLDLPLMEARHLQKTYFRKHGTTMRGLMDIHDVDPLEFMDYVHNIDLSPVDPSPRLDAALTKLPGRKVIYTNGDVGHAERVTDKLGIQHHFDGIFDIIQSDYVPKPDPRPYDKMISTFGLDPRNAIMVEDMAKNLVPAHALGMATVWVTSDGTTDNEWARDQSDGEHIHHATDDLVTWLEGVVGD